MDGMYCPLWWQLTDCCMILASGWTPRAVLFTSLCRYLVGSCKKNLGRTCVSKSSPRDCFSFGDWMLWSFELIDFCIRFTSCFCKLENGLKEAPSGKFRPLGLKVCLVFSLTTFYPNLLSLCLTFMNFEFLLLLEIEASTWNVSRTRFYLD